MDDFYTACGGLTPDKLDLDVRQLDVGGTKVVEIQPTFEDAPSNWLELFDRRDTVPDFCNISVPGRAAINVVVAARCGSLFRTKSFRTGVSLESAPKSSYEPILFAGSEHAEVSPPEDYRTSLQDGGIVFTFDFSVEKGRSGYCVES